MTETSENRTDLTAQLMPWAESNDPALSLALYEMRWYAKRRNASRLYYQASELLLLAVTAGTTVAAALSAPPLVTASLAAVAVFLTGFRQTFDPHGRWLACSAAWREIREAVWNYHFGSNLSRSDELVTRLNEISRDEFKGWVASERSRKPTAKETPSDTSASPQTGAH